MSLEVVQGSLLIRSDISPAQARPSTRTAPTATAARRREKVTADDLRRFSRLASDLADPEVMR
jgi:hypothetical protein